MTFPLLVFADDWGRHPSSCQHLVRQLLPKHPTLWVNTIGTRTPRLDRATLKRAAGKFHQWSRRGTHVHDEPLPPGLTICNPRMWPWLTRKIDRRLNRSLLLRQLGPKIAALADPPIAITTLPIVADLMGRLSVAKWVYYCVDDFGEWPGLDRRTMSLMEETVVAKADIIVAASENLQARLKNMDRDSHLLTHGVDVDFWNASQQALSGLAQLERPLIAFWGVIDRRMDTAFIQNLAEYLTQGTIVLTGPEQEPDPVMAHLPRIYKTGALPFASLPALAREAAVLIMPYADQPVTRAMQPLKLKEYLATGRPVVVRDLPANRDWADALDLVSTPEQFVQAVKLRLETGLPPEHRLARARLVQESWQSKAQRLDELLNE